MWSSGKPIKPAATAAVKPTPPPLEEDDHIMKELRERAPWVFEAIPMLGWDEVTYDKELTALCWPHTDDCKWLKTVIGKSNAWCSGFWCGILQKIGIKHPRSGSASMWRASWPSQMCGYIFGAFVPMRHANMTNHICVFLWWIDESQKIAACLGGNQSNKVSIAAYNLSGNDRGHAQCVNGPRWPAGLARTKGPYRPKGWKVGVELGGSTR